METIVYIHMMMGVFTLVLLLSGEQGKVPCRICVLAFLGWPVALAAVIDERLRSIEMRVELTRPVSEPRVKEVAK